MAVPSYSLVPLLYIALFEYTNNFYKIQSKIEAVQPSVHQSHFGNLSLISRDWWTKTRWSLHSSFPRAFCPGIFKTWQTRVIWKVLLIFGINGPTSVGVFSGLSRPQWLSRTLATLALVWLRHRQSCSAVERRRFSAAPLSVKGLESTATSMGEFVIQKFV